MNLPRLFIPRPALMLRLLPACLALVACNLSAGGLPTTPLPATPPPIESRLIAVWVDGGSLFIWRTGEEYPRRIASGAVIDPILSPDGAYVAYTRGPGGHPLSLWVADTDGVAERELIGTRALNPESGDFVRQIGQVAWLDGHTLLFNTALAPALPGPGGGKADDLWAADAHTSSAARLLSDGAGGDFAPSPDGTLIALATPGRYEAADGHIRLVDPAGTPVAGLLDFPAVSTASEYAFYPALDWLADSSALLTAIPDPDLIYPAAPGEAPRQAVLWRLDAAGGASSMGSVPAAFFGLPRWSPDGRWLTYLEQIGAPEENALRLMLAAGDGSAAAAVVTGLAGALEPPQWSEAGYTYTYGDPGRVWLGAPGAPPIPFPMAGESAYGLIWVGPDTAVYTSAPYAPYELRLFDRTNPMPAVITAVAEGLPAFDAVQIP